MKSAITFLVFCFGLNTGILWFLMLYGIFHRDSD